MSRAIDATSRACRVVVYFASDACSPVSVPASARRVICATSSCICVTSESMRVSRSCTIWFLASGRPNWMRWVAYAAAAS